MRPKCLSNTRGKSVELPTMESDTTGFCFIAKPMRRAENERLITGKGRFSDDFEFDGQTYAAMVRSWTRYAPKASSISRCRRRLQHLESAAGRQSHTIRSSPRKRGPRLCSNSDRCDLGKDWIPASAGMSGFGSWAQARFAISLCQIVTSRRNPS
jgi:hypothetical protein